LYNLQDERKATTILSGRYMDEISVLSELEGRQLQMTLRDISTLRLMLACIFNDMVAMEEMMDRLSSFVLFDRPLDRQHIRLTFGGIAGLLLARKYGNEGDSARKHRFLNQAKALVGVMTKYQRIGSRNAIPVCCCFRAVEKDQPKMYDDAIRECISAKMLHLGALMNEHCGMHYYKSNNKNENRAAEYLEEAMWLYQEWGAVAKVQQLKRSYPFLNHCRMSAHRAGSIAVSRELSERSSPVTDFLSRTSDFFTISGASPDEKQRFPSINDKNDLGGNSKLGSRLGFHRLLSKKANKKYSSFSNQHRRRSIDDTAIPKSGETEFGGEEKSCFF
jgi:hypothetical protein